MRNEGNLYIAEASNLFIRKSDSYIMGDALLLCNTDSIDNYEEKEFSKEELNVFFVKDE